MSGFLWIAAGLIAFSVVAACFIGPANAFLSGLFPVGMRYSGVAFGYGLGSAIAAGSMPFFSTLLIDWTGNLMMPALLLIGMAFVGLISVYAGRTSSLTKEETGSSPCISLTPYPPELETRPGHMRKKA